MPGLLENLFEVKFMGVLEKSFWRDNWPRFHLLQVMILIALIAIGLRVAGWWGNTVLRAPDWWTTNWREKPARDAWDSPVAIRVTAQDDLRSVLARFQAATVHTRLRRGLLIYVDGRCLVEAGRTLESSVMTDIDTRGIPAREFLRITLEPLGLACKLQDGAVMVTSRESLDELIDYGPNHGEVFCGHGERVPFLVKPPGPPLFSAHP